MYHAFFPNRNVSDVCGFTRQVLIAVTSHIESTEFKRIELLNAGLHSENPRSSNTDDVECLFSVVRDLIGKNFTVKQVELCWRKVCLEFYKRLNPELPFFYFTSSHDRFHEGERPSFDQPPKRVRKSSRLPSIETSAVFKSGRATLPKNKSLHVRAQFHNPPVQCLSPPSVPTHMADHSYGRYQRTLASSDSS